MSLLPALAAPIDNSVTGFRFSVKEEEEYAPELKVVSVLLSNKGPGEYTLPDYIEFKIEKPITFIGTKSFTDVNAGSFSITVEIENGGTLLNVVSVLVCGSVDRKNGSITMRGKLSFSETNKGGLEGYEVADMYVSASYSVRNGRKSKGRNKWAQMKF